MNAEELWHPVYLSDQLVGHLVQRGNNTRFTFVDGYWETADRRSLGLCFEQNRSGGKASAMKLPPWFSNLLPEGPLREWIAKDRGVKAERELELLLRLGGDLPGAVVVKEGERRQGEDSFESQSRDDDVESPSVMKFSLAGVGLKLSMTQKGGRFVLPVKDELGKWILKFPDPEYARIPANEDAMMTLAGMCGIEVPEHHLVHRDEIDASLGHLWKSSEDVAYVVRRFDRDGSGGRIHIEDFAQVRGILSGSSEKYQGSFETVGALCYRDYDLEALRQWARRIAFNLAIGNGDAHLKNWSLIYPDGRRPTLSPAYDLVATVFHIPEDDLGLKFNGTREFGRVRPGGFARLEKKLGADGADLESLAEETVNAVLGNLEAMRDRHSDVARELDWIEKNAAAMRRRLFLTSLGSK